MNEVTKATETLQRLESDLAKATDRATTLQTERRKLSFAAHSGDKAARTKLDKLTGESLTAGLEIENLIAAADEAKTRLAEAEHQAGLAAQRRAQKKLCRLSNTPPNAERAFAT
jgi:predicted nucleotide-binding protein